MNPEESTKKAIAKRKENKKFFERLKRNTPKDFDRQMHQLHEEVFACTDCLQCANCCKTTGPLLTQKDIERISKHTGVKPAEFEKSHLRLDEDGDWVFKQMPCMFLESDNRCGIYEIRPKACREYPHTDRVRQHQILNLTRKNTEVCPAVFQIVERLKSEIK